MLVSVYYMFGLLNAPVLIMFVHIYMNVNKLCLNQTTLMNAGVIIITPYKLTSCVDARLSCHSQLGSSMSRPVLKQHDHVKTSPQIVRPRQDQSPNSTYKDLPTIFTEAGNGSPTDNDYTDLDLHTLTLRLQDRHLPS